ncbi:Alcohol dehydrogenase, class IV [Butyrivibrio proteoclasticus]|uniref:Alcohol dehydrogenase, class IV n=1 Tax=Butyrivibrio proteoclasticus TaxID=43305 RepID=A0A1I5VVP8_9FIRM|nr:Alcohol dehydrogenase, class IV [Butyrivibrio proteoclasticus]
MDKYVKEKNIQSIFLVCGDSLQYLKINDYISDLSKRIKIVKFSDFKPNPLYESVVEGVRKYRESGCDFLMAVGGGSAIDVAKCIKLYAKLPGDGKNGSWLQSDGEVNNTELLVIPTTAGTGSEATRYAVVYYGGNKQSITSDTIIPDAVLFDPRVLDSLPDYQKKSTVMDALCHAVESFWSVNSTNDSKEYSRTAIELIIENIDEFVVGDNSKNSIMQKAAFIAGKAINITQTTAGHAMCYGLTSKYGISHGHAAALCVRELWPWMLKASEEACIDKRGNKYLKETFIELAEAFGENDLMDGCMKFQNIVDRLELMHLVGNKEDIEELSRNVNPVRLSNNPVKLNEDDITNLYKEIVR